MNTVGRNYPATEEIPVGGGGGTHPINAQGNMADLSLHHLDRIKADSTSQIHQSKYKDIVQTVAIVAKYLIFFFK